MKRKGEAYQLHWRQKADFVRMATRLGAVIVPFGALGADDACVRSFGRAACTSLSLTCNVVDLMTLAMTWPCLWQI